MEHPPTPFTRGILLTDHAMTFQYNSNLRNISKKLRNESTQSEVVLWNRIKRKALDVSFHRQFPIENYVLDFYCKELKLAIEIDGYSHDNEEAQTRDQERQERLESYGIRFVRLDDREVMNDIENAVRSIEEAIREIKTKQTEETQPMEETKPMDHAEPMKHPPTPLHKGDDKRYHEILKTYWGYDNFRGIQEDIIRSIGDGCDTLGLMPTGGGKSITFQVPAMSKEGVCLVVTPLIALMKDQVRNLRERGIKAQAIYSGMTREEILVALENCIFGDFKFLYISPERLATEIFLTKVRRMKVSMITVDESHCISQWGYDFRPAYLKIAEIRALLPDVPVLALTATATPQVVDDIRQRLGFREGSQTFRMSFERKNLAYIVRHTNEKQAELLHILNRVAGCGIVYTRNRERTREISDLLNEKGITATYYHAGLNNEVKDLRQKSWLTGECRVMVATNAFGMGIDKPDVRIVVHIDPPDSPEAYFQEAGRAGRDGQKAYAVLLFTPDDKRILLQRVPSTFPDKDYIRTVYEHVNYHFQMAMGDGLGCTFAFNLDEFCANFKHFPLQADSALRILTRAGYLEYTDEQDNASRLIFTIHRDELYRIREQDADTERLINIILRSYTGLFTDYACISEDALATRSGMTRRQVYETLLMLTRRRIVHYIPHRKTPFIVYTRERQEASRIHLSREVYEDRKESYSARIDAMAHYATTPDQCRSRMLLTYFGEKDGHDCRQCDVCLAQHASGLRTWEYNDLKENILGQLKEQPLAPEALTVPLDKNRDKWVQTLRFLMAEEIIQQKDGLLYADVLSLS